MGGQQHQMHSLSLLQLTNGRICFLFRLPRDFNSWTKKDYPVILIKAGLQTQMFCLMMMIISQESHVVFNQSPAVVGHVHGKWESVNETPDPVQTETL